MQATSTKKSNVSGFSMVELMLAMTIMLIVLGILSSILVGLNYQLNTQKTRIESVTNAQAAADTIIRMIRLAGNRPVGCNSSFVVDPLKVSVPVTGGYFESLTIESDWNQPDCNLNGVDEKVTFSVEGDILYLDAPRTIEFVDKIRSIRFMLFDENNNHITDSNLANGAKFIRIEINTISSNGAISTMTTGAAIRK